jgi:hypothetical protein
MPHKLWAGSHGFWLVGRDSSHHAHLQYSQVVAAPSGASLVYFSKDIIDECEALDQHGRCRFPSFDPATNEKEASGYPTKYIPNACKFDAGSRPNAIILGMLQDSLTQVVQLNMSAVQSQLKTLMEPLFLECKDLLKVPTGNTNRAYHLIGLLRKDMTAHDIRCSLRYDVEAFAYCRIWALWLKMFNVSLLLSNYNCWSEQRFYCCIAVSLRILDLNSCRQRELATKGELLFCKKSNTLL